MIVLSLVMCFVAFGVSPAFAQQNSGTVTISEDNNQAAGAQLTTSIEGAPVELTEQQMETVKGEKVSYWSVRKVI